MLTINSLHPYYRYQFTITAVTISSGPSTATFTVRTQQDGMSHYYDLDDASSYIIVLAIHNL